MRKGLLLLVLVLTLLPIVSAFAGGVQEKPKATSDSVAAESKFAGQTLTIMMQNQEGDIEPARAQYAAFEKKYGVKIELEVLPSGDAGVNLRRIRVATKSLSDYLLKLSE